MLPPGRKVSSLQLSIDEPLSPELALVCPELAERARRVLPDPGWLAPVVRLHPPPAAPRTSRLATLMLALFALATTVPPLLFVALQSPTVHH
jgi:hypothetical protein